MSAELVRNELGQVVSGVLGPNGSRGDPLTRIKRRLDIRLEKLFEERNSVEEFAEAAAEAFENPEKNPLLLQQILTRIWPAPQKHEISGRDGGPIEVASAREWASLAEDFGEEVASLAEHAEGSSEPGPAEGTP